MKKLFILIIFLLLGWHLAQANPDSMGVRKVGGNTYIVHKVNKGQGIYTIAKMYGVTIAELESLNPEIKGGLAPYQLILVPIRPHSSTTAKRPPVNESPSNNPQRTTNNEQLSINNQQPATNNQQPATKSPIYHTVTSGETIYRVAVNHKITVDQLKAWNSLSNNNLEVGQQLIVGYKTADARQTDVVVKETEKDSQTRINDKKNLKVNTLPDGSQTPVQTGQKEGKTDKKKTGKNEPREIDETVSASSIDDASLGEGMNLALHRSAPQGTIIKVTNPMNNKVVFVKVIGQLRDAPGDSKIAIKITRNAADKLGIVDKVFRLQLHYSTQ